MPDFGNPFLGLAKDRKVTKEELIRAKSDTFSARKYKGNSRMYIQLALNQRIISWHQENIKDIADEEKVHAGNS